MNQTKYVIGSDENGDHTFLVLDPGQQLIAIVQENEEEDEQEDIVVLPPQALALILSLVARHTDQDGNLANMEKLSVN